MPLGVELMGTDGHRKMLKSEFNTIISPRNSGDVACDYFFSSPGDEENRKVTISAKTDEDVLEAEEYLGVIKHSGRVSNEISFSSFKVLGQTPRPPICNHHELKSALLGGD